MLGGVDDEGDVVGFRQLVRVDGDCELLRAQRLRVNPGRRPCTSGTVRSVSARSWWSVRELAKVAAVPRLLRARVGRGELVDGGREAADERGRAAVRVRLPPGRCRTSRRGTASSPAATSPHRPPPTTRRPDVRWKAPVVHREARALEGEPHGSAHGFELGQAGRGRAVGEHEPVHHEVTVVVRLASAAAGARRPSGEDSRRTGTNRSAAHAALTTSRAPAHRAVRATRRPTSAGFRAVAPPTPSARAADPRR